MPITRPATPPSTPRLLPRRREDSSSASPRTTTRASPSAASRVRSAHLNSAAADRAGSGGVNVVGGRLCGNPECLGMIGDVSPAPGHPALRIDVDADSEVTVVTLVGVLSVEAAPRLRDALVRCITDQPSAVMVDLARVDVQQESTLSMFHAVARLTGEWSDTRLVLVAGRVGRGLESRAIARFVPVHPTLDAALDAAVRSASRGRASNLVERTVPPHSGSLSSVGSLVAEVCDRWRCATIAADVRAIVYELVSNAIRHAHTDASLRLNRRRDALTVTVVDGDPSPPAMIAADPGHPRTAGYGLVIVDALARQWGYTRMAGGKVVWATVPAPT